VSVQALPLSDLQQQILDSLRKDGIATADVRELHGEELWAAAQAEIAPWVEEQNAQLALLGDRPEGKDDFIVRRFMRQKPRVPFTPDSPWLRIGVSDAQLGVVNAYRGLQTSLFYMDNWFTQPYAGQDSGSPRNGGTAIRRSSTWSRSSSTCPTWTRTRGRLSTCRPVSRATVSGTYGRGARRRQSRPTRRWPPLRPTATA